MAKTPNTTSAPEIEEQPKMRTVMLAAPSYDGKVTAWHTAALVETAKIGLANGINVLPVYMSYDALVQRARNDIFKLAYDSQVDDLFFIDCDVDWNPLDFFKLLQHDVSIVAAPIIKKSDMQQYSVKLLGDFVVEDNGLARVDGVATGFMRIRRDAIIALYEAAPEYQELHKTEPTRAVFNVRVVEGQLISEDIAMCEDYKNLGGTVWIDPLVNCGHSGDKRWVGDFYEWIKLFGKR